MKVKHVAYLGSYGYTQRFPEPLGPEFVFIGRSNVGKSSLINTLVGRKRIARTSNAPGKTRTANFYPVNHSFCFVDVPGYGYAKVPKNERATWKRIVTGYVAKRDALRGVIHLLDVRHTPNADDREVSAKLKDTGKPVCLVFNKIDKVKRREIDRKIAEHIEHLSVDSTTAVVPFSAETGQGRPQLWAWIEERLSL